MDNTVFMLSMVLLCFNLAFYLVALGLSCGHVGSSSLTSTGIWDPCIGSIESSPLDRQGSDGYSYFYLFFLLPYF